MSSVSDVSHLDDKQSLDGSPTTENFKPFRPSLAKSNVKRASSVFGSFRGLKLPTEDDEPLSASSTRSNVLGEYLGEEIRDRQVLKHGEVQTSSSMFRKKKEYLVLTESHLLRFKTHAKAAESFSAIPSPHPRPNPYRHGHSASAGSTHDLQSLASETSGERHLGTPLRQLIAVYHLDDGRPHFALEIFSLDDETNNAASMTLQFGDPEDMFTWLTKIREASNRARLADANPISAYNSHLAARIVEAERDYVPPHYAIYKVVLRPQGKTTTRSSSDDLAKLAACVCFLVIGVHKVHLIPLFKPPSQRSSSPSLAYHPTQSSYGILTLSEVSVSEVDDTFHLAFRWVLIEERISRANSIQETHGTVQSSFLSLTRIPRHSYAFAACRGSFEARVGVTTVSISCSRRIES